MNYLHDYMRDGAAHSAKAVLAYLQMNLGDGIEASWDDHFKKYKARPTVARWENCREQGYVVSMNAHGYGGDQLNIAWFEHRNSDEICAVAWTQHTTNAPTIDTAKFGPDVYKDKFDVSRSVQWDKAADMATWIFKQLENHWKPE